MTSTRIALSAGVLILALGGCTDDPSEDTEAADADLQVEETSLGEVLVDAEGMTLYLFTEDQGATSTCYDSCAAAWPPAIVEDTPQPGPGLDPALVGTTVRDDGTTQLTYADQPLYRWASDASPGDVTGQGVEDVWFVVAPDGQAVTDQASGTGSSEGPSY